MVYFHKPSSYGWCAISGTGGNGFDVKSQKIIQNSFHLLYLLQKSKGGQATPKNINFQKQYDQVG